MVSAVPWLSCKKPDGLAPILQNVDAFFQITREDAVFVNKRHLMMVFIKTEACSETVNFNALTGMQESVRLRRDDDRFAVNGRIGGSKHDGKTSGDCKSIKTHFEIVRLILTAARGNQISPQGESVSIEMKFNS